MTDEPEQWALNTALAMVGYVLRRELKTDDVKVVLIAEIDGSGVYVGFDDDEIASEELASVLTRAAELVS